MFEATLIRSVTFSAGHRYGRAGWSDARNAEAFGTGVHPHGHNYRLEVVVRGEPDPDTGFVVDLAALDRLLREEVVERLDQRSLNEEIQAFREGTLQPSTEALARWAYDLLRGRIPGEARLVKVRVAESESLAAEYGTDGP